MNTICYDSRSFNFYQFFGDLIDATGFNPLDYQNYTVKEQAFGIAFAILLGNKLVDYHGEPTNLGTLVCCIEITLEKRNVLPK